MEYFPASDDQYGYCPWTGVLRHSLDIDVNMDIACSMRIIKQNAIQSLYAGSKSRRWAVVNECELTNHSGYLEIWRHMRFSCFRYYIAFAMAMSYESCILFCITGSSVPERQKLHDESYVDCRIQVCRFWPIKIQFNLTVIWANDAPQVWALVADPGGSHCQVHRFQKTDVLRFYNWLTYWSWQFHLHIPFYRYWWDLNQKGLHLRTRRMNCKKKFLFGESFLTSYW